MASALDTWNQTKFAAKSAAVKTSRATFPVAALALQMAATAEAQSSTAQQFQASQQRERISHNIRAYSAASLPTFNDAYAMNADDEAAQQTAEDSLTEAYEYSRADTDGQYDYGNAKAQSRARSIRYDLNAAQSAADERHLIDEIKAAVPGAFGDVGAPCEDLGVTLGSSTAVITYQALVTIFPEVGDRLEATPLAAILPPRFNYRSGLGAGAIVNAALVWLFANTGLVIGISIFILICIIIFGIVAAFNPVAGVELFKSWL